MEGSVGTTPNSDSLDTGLDLYLFAINMEGVAQNFFTGRFYSTTIDVYDEESGAYVPAREFMPCVKDGYVAFYDNVSKTMFRPFPAIAAEGNVCKPGLMVTFR